MDTSRYRAFVQASDQGSLSKAAKTLNYTPSGVSQLITALERDLGFSVLERNPHGVQPTSEGSRILPAARAVVQEEERLLQVSSEIKGLAIGQVTIGSYPSVAAHWLPGVIKVFHERYPNIEVRIMEGIHQEITEWLDSKEADVGFMSYEPSLTYDWIPLARDPMVAALPLDHPFASEENYPIEECVNEAFIMPGKGQDIDTTRILSRHGLNPNIAYETIETVATPGMIEAGMGMTIINSLAVKKYGFELALVPIEPPESILFGIAASSLKTCAPATRRFIDCAVAQLEE